MYQEDTCPRAQESWSQAQPLEGLTNQVMCLWEEDTLLKRGRWSNTEESMKWKGYFHCYLEGSSDDNHFLCSLHGREQTFIPNLSLAQKQRPVWSERTSPFPGLPVGTVWAVTTPLYVHIPAATSYSSCWTLAVFSSPTCNTRVIKLIHRMCLSDTAESMKNTACRQPVLSLSGRLLKQSCLSDREQVNSTSLYKSPFPELRTESKSMPDKGPERSFWSFTQGMQFHFTVLESALIVSSWFKANLSKIIWSSFRESVVPIGNALQWEFVFSEQEKDCS